MSGAKKTASNANKKKEEKKVIAKNIDFTAEFLVTVNNIDAARAFAQRLLQAIDNYDESVKKQQEAEQAALEEEERKLMQRLREIKEKRGEVVDEPAELTKKPEWVNAANGTRSVSPQRSLVPVKKALTVVKTPGISLTSKRTQVYIATRGYADPDNFSESFDDVPVYPQNLYYLANNIVECAENANYTENYEAFVDETAKILLGASAHELRKTVNNVVTITKLFHFSKGILGMFRNKPVIAKLVRMIENNEPVEDVCKTFIKN